jgi:large subunit ribosomal protein L21
MDLEREVSETAIFETGSRQYSASIGDIVRVPSLSGEAGDSITFDRVMFLRRGDECAAGRPYVEGARVTGEIVNQGRDDKVIVFKFKRRTTYRQKNGHRQPHTAVRITGIEG